MTGIPTTREKAVKMLTGGFGVAYACRFFTDAGIFSGDFETVRFRR